MAEITNELGGIRNGSSIHPGDAKSEFIGGNLMSSSMAIANIFLTRHAALGRVTQMQLQKLTYFAHGWSLAISGSPLIVDHVQAWDYGPVFPDLYEFTKLNGKNSIEKTIRENDKQPAMFFLGNEHQRGLEFCADLEPIESEIIERVWNRYKNYSAFQLSALTHKPGTPWYQTFVEGHGRNACIDNRVIESHYRELARHAE